MVLDFWAIQKGVKWQEKAAFNAEIAEITDGAGEKVLLAKPTTFYNESGKAVAAICKFYKLDVNEDLLVVCDDFRLSYGEVRYQRGGSDGGNNGLKSTTGAIGSDFARLRLGTGSAAHGKMSDADFVLGKFSPEEREKLPGVLEEAVEEMVAWQAE